MDLSSIDWSAMWKASTDVNQGTQNPVNTWDHEAARWSRSIHNGNYAEQIISRMNLRPNWTVLDVGCGAGALALPMAQIVKKVTAIDVSKNMLRCLKENADREQLTNIECRNGLMEDWIVGKDLEKHDVVIASRSIGLVQRDIKRALKSIDNAATKYAYVTWRASERTFDIGLHKAIGRIHQDSPNYVILYNCLNQMGIYANVELIHVNFSMVFQSLDEAFNQYKWRFINKNEGLNPEEEEKLEEYLKNNLHKNARGTFDALDSNPAWALIWWKKEDEA